MLIQVFYISITGVGVVFSFLFIIFLLLKGLKLFAVDEVETKQKQPLRKKKIQEKL